MDLPGELKRAWLRVDGVRKSEFVDKRRFSVWQITDHTDGKLLVALEREWGTQTAGEALKRSHSLGAAMDIAYELMYLGFTRHEDFDIRPTKSVSLTL